jgi:hypothetical protein
MVHTWALVHVELDAVILGSMETETDARDSIEKSQTLVGGAGKEDGVNTPL